jgi:hypothetical protein
MIFAEILMIVVVKIQEALLVFMTVALTPQEGGVWVTAIFCHTLLCCRLTGVVIVTPTV